MKVCRKGPGRRENKSQSIERKKKWKRLEPEGLPHLWQPGPGVSAFAVHALGADAPVQRSSSLCEESSLIFRLLSPGPDRPPPSFLRKVSSSIAQAGLDPLWSLGWLGSAILLRLPCWDYRFPHHTTLPARYPLPVLKLFKKPSRGGNWSGLCTTRWGILSTVHTAGIRRQATWHRENTLEDSQYMNTACVSEEKMLRALSSQLVQRH